MDLRLYNYSVPMTPAVLEGSSPTSRLETIANKVVKYLLTTQGSDGLNKQYGVYLWTTADYNNPKVNYDVANNIKSCIDYIRNTEKGLSSTVEKLATIKLISVVPTRANMAYHLSITIRIVTTFNNIALLDLSHNAIS